jgi:hypothetical protein
MANIPVTKIPKNVLIPAIGLILFAAVAAGAYFNVFKIPEKYLPAKNLGADAAAKKAIDFVNKNLLSQGMTASYKDVKDENGLYTFKLTVQGQDYDAYVTKNGKLFFAQGIPQAIPLDQSLESTNARQANITKSDKPDVKLFVMSYCPFGLQAEKMYLPVYDLLKDKVNFGIYFVNYAMHGKKEIDENLRQYCTQKEQGDKYNAYLKCFIEGTASADGTGEYAKCLTDTGIDKTKLNACIASIDKEFKVTSDYNDKSTWVSGSFPKFAVNDDLNAKYNVQGSPTIVINDADASAAISSRSPEAFKQVVCSSFKNEPDECKTALSGDQPSSGFGAGTEDAASAGGGCAN